MYGLVAVSFFLYADAVRYACRNCIFSFYLEKLVFSSKELKMLLMMVISCKRNITPRRIKPLLSFYEPEHNKYIYRYVCIGIGVGIDTYTLHNSFYKVIPETVYCTTRFHLI